MLSGFIQFPEQLSLLHSFSWRGLNPGHREASKIVRVSQVALMGGLGASFPPVLTPHAYPALDYSGLLQSATCRASRRLSAAPTPWSLPACLAPSLRLACVTAFEVV